ncbi:hypothetical protein HWV62_36611 [Athelia sp. TMB]|nr:hypothetical protein HWV62_36611 [Athelia sp. TMB]
MYDESRDRYEVLTSGFQRTNVLELYSRLDDSDKQLSFYNSGIGTSSRPLSAMQRAWHALDSGIDQAIAWNFDTKIVEAYRWLANSYVEGDRIYLFGFSRGAYQMRVLAAMIKKTRQVGLIKRGNDWQIPNALWLYKSKDGKMAQEFKDTFCVPNVRVHFVGVWDTVSSVGVVGNKVLPHIDEYNHIDIFRHALALDERRVKFIPECVMGRGKTISEKTDVMGEGKQVDRVKEVWFPGSHSNVGGGGGFDPLQAIPLAWMMKEAVEAGLLLKPKASKPENAQDAGVLKPGSKISHLLRRESSNSQTSEPRPTSFSIYDLQTSEPRNSLRHVWWLVEIFPVHRQSRAKPTNTSHWRLHNGKGRGIYEDQKIHASVLFMGRTYKPGAVFRSQKHSIQWERLMAPSAGNLFGAVDGWEALLEMDLFELDNGPSGIALFHGGGPDDMVRVLDSLWMLASLDDVAAKMLAAKDKRLSDLLLRNDPEKARVFLSTVRLLARLSVSAIRVANIENTSSITPARWPTDELINPAVGQKVVELLQESRPAEVRALAASAVAELAPIQRLRETFKGVVKILVEMLQLGISKGNRVTSIAYAAANALVALAAHDDFQKYIFTLVCTAPATGMLQVIPESPTSPKALPIRAQTVDPEVAFHHTASQLEGSHTVLPLPSQAPKKSRPRSMDPRSLLPKRKQTIEPEVEVVSPSRYNFDDLTGSHITGPIALLAAELAHYLANATQQDLPSGLSADEAKKVIIINENTISSLTKTLNNPDQSYAAAEALAKLAEQERFRDLMVDNEDFIPNLIQAICDTNTSAVKALATLMRNPEKDHHVRDLVLRSNPGSSTTKQALLAIVQMLGNKACDSAMLVLTEFLSNREAAIMILQSTAPKVLMGKLNATGKRSSANTDQSLLPKCIATVIQAYFELEAKNDAEYSSGSDLDLPPINSDGASHLADLVNIEEIRATAADTIAALVKKDARNRQILTEQGNHTSSTLFQYLQGAQRKLMDTPEISVDMESLLVSQIASITMALAELDPEDTKEHPVFIQGGGDENIDEKGSRDEQDLPDPLKQLTGLWRKKLIPIVDDTMAGDSKPIKSGSHLDPYGQQVDKVAAAVAVMLGNEKYREAFGSLELVERLSIRLGARFQSGTWAAIKALASSHASDPKSIPKRSLTVPAVKSRRNRSPTVTTAKSVPNRSSTMTTATTATSTSAASAGEKSELGKEFAFQAPTVINVRLRPRSQAAG